ncbi:TetR/AcrR family transcriptional regulator [Intestinibacter sp.]
MNTKERILHEALELFSKNGFEAVSMRDIGASVGIRESSIYKHYSNKQGILDAIVERSMQEIDNMLDELNVPNPDTNTSVSRYVDMKFEDIAKLCTDMLLRQRHNEIVSKFRQLLTIEQYRNEELKKIYIENFMERQLQYNEKVFEYLLNLGVMKGESPAIMALQFYSPFFLLQYKLQDDNEKLEQDLKKYVVSFLNEHLKEEIKK